MSRRIPERMRDSKRSVEGWQADGRKCLYLHQTDPEPHQHALKSSYSSHSRSFLLSLETPGHRPRATHSEMGFSRAYRCIVRRKIAIGHDDVSVWPTLRTDDVMRLPFRVEGLAHLPYPKVRPSVRRRLFCSQHAMIMKMDGPFC
jgi:hypothetical protein